MEGRMNIAKTLGTFDLKNASGHNQGNNLRNEKLRNRETEKPRNLLKNEKSS
jgi:hypothetical protein